tara:strand:+ start:248 stop:409 length:162 start_codon:yes stop_codon:yes gene_type:complete
VLVDDSPGLNVVAVNGIHQYVKEGRFPDDDHSYGVDDKVCEKIATLVDKRKQI